MGCRQYKSCYQNKNKEATSYKLKTKIYQSNIISTKKSTISKSDKGTPIHNNERKVRPTRVQSPYAEIIDKMTTSEHS